MEGQNIFRNFRFENTIETVTEQRFLFFDGINLSHFRSLLQETDLLLSSYNFKRNHQHHDKRCSLQHGRESIQSVSHFSL